MTATITLTTIIDIDIATANNADGMSDPAFAELCERFEAILEAECERMGWEVEVIRDGRTSGNSTTTISDDEDGRRDDLLSSAIDIVNACWDRALAA